MVDICSFGSCAFNRQAVEGEGPLTASIVLIGEAPGRVELRTGRPFQGPAGKKLDELLGRAGLRRQDIRVTNTCACVDMNRDDKRPLPAELEACRPRLDAELDMIDPAVILLMGNTALQVFFEGYKIGEVYGVLRATAGRVVIPTYHPSHLLRGARQVEPIILEALRKAKRISEGD